MVDPGELSWKDIMKKIEKIDSLAASDKATRKMKKLLLSELGPGDLHFGNLPKKVIKKNIKKFNDSPEDLIDVLLRLAVKEFQSRLGKSSKKK